MLAMAEPVRADRLNGAVDVVSIPETDAKVVKADGSLQDEDVPTAGRALEERVEAVVKQLAENTAGQPAALGKWAFWTQVGMTGAGTEGGGDGYEDAVNWAGRAMALHARAEDAREGIAAFFEKRKPVWKT